MRNWNAYYAEQDRKEKERVQRQLSRSAPTQAPSWSSLISGSSHPGGVEPRQRRISALALETRAPHARSDLGTERSLEELRDQMGVISQVLHGIDQNIVHNHHASLDRFDGLREQITRENRRLMSAIGTIRRESNCDLSNPTTYIYCLKLIYVLIFRIFKFLCELIFVVGNSFKEFLGHMPFPFCLLVFIAYIFQMLLIFIVFDTTLRVSTLGTSHSMIVHHNSLFGHSNGAPEFISPRDALYQGLFRSGLFVLSQMLLLMGAVYESLLGRDIQMIQRETSRYISSQTVVEEVKKHVVEPLKEKAAEKLHSVVNNVVNDQVGIMGAIPGQLGELAAKGAQGAASIAGRGVEGAGSLAGKALEGAGSLAQGAAEGIAARAERLRQIDPEDVKESARVAAEAAAAAAETAFHAAKRFGSGLKTKFFGGSRTRKNSGSHSRGSHSRRSHNRRSNNSRKLTLKNKDIPVFSLLTKPEQKVFEKSFAGKQLNKIEKMIDAIDYSKIEPNPQLFSTIHFTLNVAERLFPIFVKELDKTVKLCKMMERQHIQPISNPNFLKELGTIVY
uniref:Uncharacterized protein n=1 Tax=viral metagenome TaxID=1070528 RepID=A0A6C0D0P3_9ZZZZ